MPSELHADLSTCWFFYLYADIFSISCLSFFISAFIFHWHWSTSGSVLPLCSVHPMNLKLICELIYMIDKLMRSHFVSWYIFSARAFAWQIRCSVTLWLAYYFFPINLDICMVNWWGCRLMLLSWCAIHKNSYCMFCGRFFFFCKRCFLFIDLLPIILFLLWLSRLFFYCSIHPPPSSHTHRHLIWSLFEAKCSRFGFSRFD